MWGTICRTCETTLVAEGRRLVCPTCRPGKAPRAIARDFRMQLYLEPLGYRRTRRGDYVRNAEEPGLAFWVNPPYGPWAGYQLTPSLKKPMPPRHVDRLLMQEYARLNSSLPRDLDGIAYRGYAPGEGKCHHCGQDAGAKFCGPTCEQAAREEVRSEERREAARMVNTAPFCADGCGRRVLDSTALVHFARKTLGVDLRFPRRILEEGVERLVCSACHARRRPRSSPGSPGTSQRA